MRPSTLTVSASRRAESAVDRAGGADWADSGADAAAASQKIVNRATRGARLGECIGIGAGQGKRRAQQGVDEVRRLRWIGLVAGMQRAGLEVAVSRLS
ncbi:MAG: hypothetical protein ABJB66_09780 [Gemmatimonadaceae bacterium]